MTKFIIIILGLILSWGGVAFTQPPPPPWMDVPGVPGVPGVVPGVPEIGIEEVLIVATLRRMFPRATFEVDLYTGFLTVDAPLDLHPKIDEAIAALDLPDPQITIEAKFVELMVTDINELGIDLDILNMSVAPTLDGGAVDIISPWVGREAAGTSIWLTRLEDADFNVVLQALEKEGKANVLSAPRVTTLNRQPATIDIYRTIPFVTGREIENVGTAEHPIMLTTFEVDYREAGVFLEVTPTVLEGCDLIELDLRPRVMTLIRRMPIFTGVAAKHGWPIIDERTTDTSLRIRSGETIVLGGLIRRRMDEVEKKVPLLGDIPLLGRVFRYTHSREVKGNLLIFITAYIVSPSGERIVVGR